MDLIISFRKFPGFINTGEGLIKIARFLKRISTLISESLGKNLTIALVIGESEEVIAINPLITISSQTA